MYLLKVQNLCLGFFSFEQTNMCIFQESVHTVYMSYILLPISGVTEVLVFLHSSCAEQLVLYMKAEECLSSALRIAKECISQGNLIPSSPVKQGENLFHVQWG